MATIVMTLALPEKTGAPMMACQFAAALHRAGHRVVVAHGPWEEADEASILPAMRTAGAETHLLPDLARLPRPGRARKLAAVLREQNADCVIGFQQRDRPLAAWAGQQAGRACVISAQNQHHFFGPPGLRQLKALAYGRALRQGARLVVCTSPVVQRELIDRFHLPADRTAVLQNGIDVRGFPREDPGQRQAIRRDLGIGPGEQMLVNVGRLDVQKGQDILLEAFAKLDNPALKLVLVGGVSRGPHQAQMQLYTDRLKAFADERGLSDRVVFAGWRDDVSAVLQAADLYVHAARWEGPAAPLTVMEALAASRPVIFTDCSGRPDAFEQDVHGRIVPTENPAALADAMQRFAALSEGERERIGQAGRRFAEQHYDIGTVGRRFTDMIESVIR
ncbi:MAG: glycosyltransferase family 4 protein [Phycisphaeraceae bacterium]